MSDAYVYFFRIWNREGCGSNLSDRPATLEAIKGKGEPIMESQIVVDETELDCAGYYVGGVGEDSYVVNRLTAQIGSLEIRAASRDTEARNLDERTESKDKYMLRLESRELRAQARRLTNQRTVLVANEHIGHDNTDSPMEHGESRITA